MTTQHLKDEYLQTMGVQRWLVRAGEEVSVDDRLPEPASDIAEPVAHDWAGLEQQVSACKKCKLHESRTQTVFGIGNRQADWLIIGEAPGAEEDRQGEPFVGPPGKLLTEMLFAAGFRRADVYIANILKCRPPENRNPQKNEVDLCTPFLDAQIDIIQPQILIPLGNFSYRYLFSKYNIPIDKISVDHGKHFCL